jgi:metal-responsive CopG/Arc/MetJ family transcriptional regulator
MRTTLIIPDRLMKELKNITPEKSKTALISEALEEYINKKRREKLVSLKGKIRIEYDWKGEEEKELLTAKEEVKRYVKKRNR